MSAGIDHQTLAALDGNLGDLAPMRARSIVEFAQKCARDRAHLSEADYENLRVQGVREEEILEIVALAAMANFLNTISDSLKLQIDDEIAQMLAA
jgi:alkylhydroperoxidase family enzyme